MDQPRVILSHGHLSSPQGRKIAELSPIAQARGYAAEAIDYRDLRDDPVARSQRLIARLRELDQPAVLVGSSMGGYVSMAAAEKVPVAGLFLMAPALFLEHYVDGGVVPDAYHPKTRHVSIVHGWRDEIIPWRNSLRFAEQSHARLYLFDADHDLHGCLHSITACLEDFLQELSG
jgi:pimeloyl-ACP methyl ester carboxylesterase